MRLRLLHHMLLKGVPFSSKFDDSILMSLPPSFTSSSPYVVIHFSIISIINIFVNRKAKRPTSSDHPQYQFQNFDINDPEKSSSQVFLSQKEN